MSAPAAIPPAPRDGQVGGRSRHAGDLLALSADVCPLLRSRDASWSSIQASRDLRCWALQPPAPPAVAKQRQLCLTAAHLDCATLQAARAADAEVPVPGPEGSLLWPVASPPVPIALEPPHSRPALAVAPPRTGGQALLVGLMLVAFVVLAISRTTQFGWGSADSTLAPSASAAASALALASPSASPSPTATPQPSAVASPTASASVSPTASATASVRTYKVRSGDTLSGIAAKFHTTVKAITAANKIADPRTIHPGQTLVIP